MGQIAISTLSIFTKIKQVIKKYARNLCAKFPYDNYKTLNIVNNNIINMFLNQILEKIHFQARGFLIFVLGQISFQARGFLIFYVLVQIFFQSRGF